MSKNLKKHRFFIDSTKNKSEDRSCICSQNKPKDFKECTREIYRSLRYDQHVDFILEEDNLEALNKVEELQSQVKDICLPEKICKQTCFFF